jgi:hypothetical protein
MDQAAGILCRTVRVTKYPEDEPELGKRWGSRPLLSTTKRSLPSFDQKAKGWVSVPLDDRRRRLASIVGTVAGVWKWV